MKEVVLKVQVHAIKPRWINFEHNRYRIYVDNDLITERTWIWDLNTYLEENIIIVVPDNSDHTIRLEPVLEYKSLAQFCLKNLLVDNVPVDCIDEMKLSFKVA